MTILNHPKRNKSVEVCADGFPKRWVTKDDDIFHVVYVNVSPGEIEFQGYLECFCEDLHHQNKTKHFIASNIVNVGAGFVGIYTAEVMNRKDMERVVGFLLDSPESFWDEVDIDRATLDTGFPEVEHVGFVAALAAVEFKFGVGSINLLLRMKKLGYKPTKIVLALAGGLKIDDLDGFTGNINDVAGWELLAGLSNNFN